MFIVMKKLNNRIVNEIINRVYHQIDGGVYERPEVIKVEKGINIRLNDIIIIIDNHCYEKMGYL
jgi:hypothetical protein